MSLTSFSGKLRRSRGQSTLEYAVLVAIVAGALIGMAVYMKRGMAGRLRSSADSVGEQYAPGQTTSNFNLTVSGKSTTTSVFQKNQNVGNGTLADVMETTTTIDPANPETTTRTGSETVGPLGTGLWK